MPNKNEYGHHIIPKATRKKNKERDKKRATRKKIITGLVIGIILVAGLSSICGGFLAWYRFAADTRNVRILKTFLAVIFGIPFMIYFFIVRVMFGMPYP